MNKKELLELSNKGITKIAGIDVEIIVKPSTFDGKDWIEIKVAPLSPLHCPLLLGQQWVEFITDKECEELEPALIKYKKEAEYFCEQAKRIVKATITDNQEILITDMPDSVKSDWACYPNILKQITTKPHKVVFLGKDHENWKALGNFAINIDENIYHPHWSYYLDFAYYIADDKIKSLGESPL